MICVFGGKGAPGASTAALLLAALYPEGGVLVEADPAGGDLALRLAGPAGQILPGEPNVTRLAVDSTASPLASVPEPVLRCALQTAVGVPVVCGLTTGDGMTQTLTRYAAPLAECLGRLDEVVVDAGRLTPAHPGLPLAAAAAVIVLVIGDEPTYFFAARDLLAALLSEVGAGTGRPRVLAAVVCPARRGRAAVGELAILLGARGLPVTVAGWIAHDPRGLRRFRAGESGARRTPLLRTAIPLSRTVVSAAVDHGRSGAPGSIASAPGIADRVGEGIVPGAGPDEQGAWR